MTKKSCNKKTFVNYHTRIHLHSLNNKEFVLYSKELLLEEKKVHIFKSIQEFSITKVKVHIQGPPSHNFPC